MGNKYRYWTKMEAMDLQPDCLTLLDKGTGSCHSASSKRSWKKWKMVKWHAVFRSWHRNYVGGGSGSTHLGKNKLTNTLNFTNLKQNCFSFKIFDKSRLNKWPVSRLVLRRKKIENFFTNDTFPSGAGACSGVRARTRPKKGPTSQHWWNVKMPLIF